MRQSKKVYIVLVTVKQIDKKYTGTNIFLKVGRDGVDRKEYRKKTKGKNI